MLAELVGKKGLDKLSKKKGLELRWGRGGLKSIYREKIFKNTTTDMGTM